MTSPQQVQDALTANLTQVLGLGTNGVAGVEGNFAVESGLRTTAYNPGEGAVGLAQWEKGRRTTLQNLAASQGTTETSLSAQLAMLDQELQGPYSSVLAQLRTAASPGQAAAIFDAGYERSAGTTRQARIDAANSIAAGGPVAGIGAGTGGSAPALGVQTVGAGGGLPPWLNGLAQSIIPGWSLSAGATGTDPLSGATKAVGHWLVDGLLIVCGLALVITALVLIAKGGDDDAHPAAPAPPPAPHPARRDVEGAGEDAVAA